MTVLPQYDRRATFDAEMPGAGARGADARGHGHTQGQGQPGRRIQLTGRAATAIDTGRLRLVVTGLLFTLAFVTTAMRLVDVSVLREAREPETSTAATSALPASRGDIVDRNGALVATTLPTASLIADPALILDAQEATDLLTSVLPGLSPQTTLNALSSERRFVWLQRGITPREQQQINRLGIPGIGFQYEQRRYHPAGSLTAHIVGYTDSDGRGIAGIEQQFNEALGNGEPVGLSIDLRLQQMVREELQAAVDEYSALGGAALVLDVDTGELLAMVSLPDFNPYARASVSEERRFNRNVQGVYEMGSTFKIFNTAMALDSGAAGLGDWFDATRPIRVGRFTISDYHAENRWLSVPEILLHSSNIGSVRMALALGAPRQQDYLRRLGLLDPAPIELPEVETPMVPDPWREVSTMTVSFGHGIAVSPVQLATAVAAVVNGGELRSPTILRRDPDSEVPTTRILDPWTSDVMRRLLRSVVEDGTGGGADAAGYLVGGKTGTAEKATSRGYARSALLSSFVAAFPMNRPEYVVFAMLDEPRGTANTHGYATGGWVAAPIIRRIVERMAPMVGLEPVDAQSPDIERALSVDFAPHDRMLASFAER